MANRPTLKIVYDANNFPVSAKCFACSEEMPQGEPRITSKEENRKWFKAQFDLHKKQKHPREDVNQAAARIVKEATER
jgi:hypothetical protein